MKKYDFSKIAAAPNASARTENLLNSQIVGLEAFLGKRIDADNVENYTDPDPLLVITDYDDGSYAMSDCSNYCSTSTCAYCC